jgi:RimJ/RimL family protein N-acetyltransferase
VTPDFATKPTLAGERAILRPFIDADLPALREAMADPDLLRLTGSIHDETEARKPVSPEEEQRRLDWFNTRNDQDHRLDLAIVDRASGGCVGDAFSTSGTPGTRAATSAFRSARPARTAASAPRRPG